MKKHQNRRIFTSFVLIGLIFTILVSNVILVSVGAYHVNSKTNFRKYVDNIYTKEDEIIAKRGSILDINGNVLVEDSTAYTLFAYIADDRYDSKDNPAFVVDKEAAAKSIGEIIGMDYDSMLAILTKEGAKQVEFGTKGKYLTPKQKEMIEALEIPGIGFNKITKRDYASEKLAPTLIGATRFNEEKKIAEGIIGIEKYYQDILVGENGLEVYRQNVDSYRHDTFESLGKDAIDGKNIKLTIDSVIQESLDNNLNQLLTDSSVKAEEAWAAVVEVKTGRVVAITDAPSFDINNPNTSYLNRALEYEYEPGSTMKTLTMAIALEEDVIKEEETFDGRPFYFHVDKNGKTMRVTKDDKYSAVVNNPAKQVFIDMTYARGYQRSSNVMFVHLLVERLDPEVYRDYMHRLGFFKPVGLDRLKEKSGTELWNYPFEKVTNAFGQGSMVTMMQIIQAHTAIFGDGTLIKPYLIESITNPNTNEVEYQAETERIEKIFGEKTVQRVRDLMYENVNELSYSVSRYKMDEVNIMAKTGTAEMVIDGAYSKDTFISSVVQGFPYEDPQYIFYYAYKAKSSHNVRRATDIMKNTIRTILTNYPEVNVKDDAPSRPNSSFEIKNYINLKVDDVIEELKDKGREILVLGDGKYVLNQYPKESVKVLSDDKILLLTSTTNIKMPDMTGWSAREVNAFAQFIGVEVNLKGSGYVLSQSIKPDSIIENNAVIDAILK